MHNYGIRQRRIISIRRLRRHINYALCIVHSALKKLPSDDTQNDCIFMGREHALHTSWCHPRSGKNSPFISAKALRCVGSAGVLLPSLVQKTLSQRSFSLWHSHGILLLRHGQRIYRRVFLGLISSRQSRSPRCRPMIRISAEARLVAQGTL